MRDIKIHTAYADATPKIPGEYLGTSSGYTRMNTGDIVTCVKRSDAEDYSGDDYFNSSYDDYYFDPECLIEGSHYQWNGRLGAGGNWTAHFPDAFVQVDYSGTLGKLYTYRDPSRRLRVGDLVEVPVTFGTKVGEVMELGRGDDYNGPIKNVLAKVKRERL